MILGIAHHNRSFVLAQKNSVVVIFFTRNGKGKSYGNCNVYLSATCTHLTKQS